MTKIIWMQLDEQLSATNGIHLPLDVDAVPMVYPYLTDDATLRQRLIANCIYVATYWPNLAKLNNDTLEECFAKKIIALPIDQRYNKEDMKRIIESII